MKKRYVILLDSSTEEQDIAFLKFIKENGLGWWHWLTNSWLITDSGGKFSAYEIRDELGVIYPEVRKMILEINAERDTWSGFGPNTESQDMFKWIKENWHE